MYLLQIAAFLAALYARNKLTQCYMFLAVAQANLLRASSPKKLITTGPYRRLRNPVYVWSLVMWLSACIVLQAPYTALFVVVVILPIQWVRARREARVLKQAFPKEYAQYIRQVWF